MKNIGIIEELERLKLLDKAHLINELIHARVEISYLKAINEELRRCNSDYYNLINKVIKHIKEHCIDDEFYINLSNKEKGIIDALTMLENGSDKE